MGEWGRCSEHLFDKYCPVFAVKKKVFGVLIRIPEFGDEEIDEYRYH